MHRIPTGTTINFTRDQQIPKQIPHTIRPAAKLGLHVERALFCNHLHEKQGMFFREYC
jgi:hypothetical protein